MKNYRESETYDAKSGVATYTYTCKKTSEQFVGTARVHPDDADFSSEYIGLTLARARAERKILKAALHDMRMVIIGIEDAYRFTLGRQKKARKVRYEASMKDYLAERRESVELLKQAIQDSIASEQSYLRAKDTLHQKLRDRAKTSK